MALTPLQQKLKDTKDQLDALKAVPPQTQPQPYNKDWTNDYPQERGSAP